MARHDDQGDPQRHATVLSSFFAPARRAIAIAAIFPAIFAIFERDVHANGRFPAANMLVEKPGDPTHLALRATYGLLFSSDSGASWDWVCERALGYSGNEDPSLLIAGSGAVVVGTFNGTVRSTDGGCHWQRDAGWPSSVVDLASRPHAPDQLYAVTCAFSAEVDVGNVYRSQLFVSPDAGLHWNVRGTLDPSLLIDSVEVAPSDAGRIYVSAVRRIGSKAVAVFLRSDDDGGHWNQTPIPFTDDDRGVYIAAVDPHDAARVYLRTSGVETSHVQQSDDGGKSFREIVHGGPMQGFALADDGASIYAGGPKDGLLRGSPSGTTFGQISKRPVQCLTAIGSSLWECAPTSAGYVVAASKDQGATFAPKLTLGGMRGPLQCAAPSAMDECTTEWSALQALVGPKDVADAAPASAAAPTATPVSTPAKRGMFSCTFAAGDCDEAREGLAFLTALFLWRGRRRRWIVRPPVG